MNHRLSKRFAAQRSRWPGMRHPLSMSALETIAGPAHSLGVALVVIGIISLALFSAYEAQHLLGLPDVITYIAAGERLNAGHNLYGPLLPGDRVLPFGTPDIPAPLLSPPLIGVLWRPLAASGEMVGLAVGWGLSALALSAALLAMGLRIPWIILGAGLVLTLQLFWAYVSGNVNTFVLLVAVATWRWSESKPGLIGSTLGVLAVAKLLPLFVVWWLVAQRSLAALRWFVMGAAISLAVSLYGAGIQAHVDFISLRPAAAPQSLGAVGPWWFPYAAAGVGLLAVVLLRRFRATSFGIAIVTMTVGTPAVTLQTYTLLIAALAPIAWPLRQGSWRGPQAVTDTP